MPTSARQKRIATALAILREETENAVIVFEDRSPISKRNYMRIESVGIREAGAHSFLGMALKYGETRREAIEADRASSDEQEDGCEQ